MSKILDFTNKQIGEITVLEYAFSKNKHKWWKCRCSCGKELYVGAQNLIRGFPKSCGCSDKNNLTGRKFNRITVLEKTNMRNYGSVVYKCQCDCGKIVYKTNRSLLSNTNENGCGCFNKKIKYKKEDAKLLHIWEGMRNRCNCKGSTKFKDYGGRGIKVCNEWLGENGFFNFKEWSINNGVNELIDKIGISEISIERIDVNGNYCPENCKWIPIRLQARNTRRSRKITINGETKCVTEWCKLYKINNSTFYNRIKNYGMTEIEALTTPIFQGKKINKIKERKFAEFGEFLKAKETEDKNNSNIED